MDKARRALQISVLLIATVFFASTAYAACTVSNCHWSKTGTYTEGTVVEMHATFSGCSGTVYYYIYESDVGTDDDVITKTGTTTTVKSWTTTWMEDAYNYDTRDYDPEYYFELYVGSSYKCASDYNLKIKQKVCTPCEKYCSGSTLRTCKSDGSGWTDTSCGSYGCDSTTASCRICTAGSKKCDGSDLLTCNSYGTSWDGFSCTYGCSSGACKTYCSPGAKRCSGSSIQKCNSQGSSWSTIDTCPGSCNANGLTATCEPICTPFAAECDGSNRKVCDSSGLSYTTTPCPSGCDSSTKQCKTYCTPNSKQCDGNTLKTCRSDGSAWDGFSCNYGCSSGACNSPPPCTASNCRWSTSESSVVEDTSVNMLADFSGDCSGKTINFDIYENDDSSADDYTTSKSVTYGNAATWTAAWADDGIAGDPEYYFKLSIGGTNQCTSADLEVDKKQVICTPGEKKCDGTDALVCDPDGYNWTGGSCAYGCISGTCKPFCNPGAKRCSGSSIQQCNSQGSNWSTIDTCPGSCNANALTATCEPICTPFISHCDSDALKTCDPSGYSYITTECPNGCDSTTDRCRKLCTANSMKCEGGTLQTCDSTGDNWVGTSCRYGCDSSTGCLPSSCTANSVSWSTNLATEGDVVTLAANVEKCNSNNKIIFEIWEDDSASNDDKIDYVTATISGNTATATWKSLFESDCIFGICGRPEYYAKVNINDVATNVASNGMEVRPKSWWQYLDAVWECIYSGDYASWGDEVTCNVAPVLELFADGRDSLKCIVQFPSTLKNLGKGECLSCFAGNPFTNLKQQLKCLFTCDENAGVDLAVCGVTFLATGYDVQSYAATIGTAIVGTPLAAAGVAASEAPGNTAVSTLKAVMKSLSAKVVRDVADTLLAVPKLVVWGAKTIERFPSALMQINSESFLKAIAKAGGDEVAAKFEKDFIDSLPDTKLTTEMFDKIGEIADFLKTNKISLDISKISNKLSDFHNLVSSGKLIDKLKVAEQAQLLKTSFPIEISFVDELTDASGNVARGVTQIVDKSTGKLLPLNDFAANKNIPASIKVTLALTNDFGTDSVKIMKDSTMFHEFAHAWQADKLLKDIDKFVINGKVFISQEYDYVFGEFFADYAPYKMLRGTDLEEFLSATKEKINVFHTEWMSTVKQSNDLYGNWLKTETQYAKAKAFGMTGVVSEMDTRLAHIAKNDPSAENLIRIMKEEKIPMFTADAQKFVDNLAYDKLTQYMIDIIKRPPTEWIPSGDILINQTSVSDQTLPTIVQPPIVQPPIEQTVTPTQPPTPEQPTITQPSKPPAQVCITKNVCTTQKQCYTKKYGFLKLFKKKVCNNVQVCTPMQICK